MKNNSAHSIMIVEDEDVFSLRLEQMLTKMGYNVAGLAHSGEEALAKIRVLKPDLVLMDIIIPGKFDGIAVAEIVKSELDIPVIFLTAYSEKDIIERFKNAEPYGFIVEPFQDSELKPVIEIALDKKEKERHLRESVAQLKKSYDQIERWLEERTEKLNITTKNLEELNIALKVLLDKRDEVTRERQNLKGYRAGLSFSNDFSRWWDSTTGQLNFGFDRFEFDTSDSYNYFATMGVKHGFSEGVNLIFNIGSSYTDADFLSLQQGRFVETNNKSFNGIGEATLEITGELTRGSIGISHSIDPGSDRTVQRTSATLNLRRLITETSVIAISTGY